MTAREDLGLSPMQKAATLLMAIGPAKSASLLRHLSENEIEQLANSVAASAAPDPQVEAAVLREIVTRAAMGLPKAKPAAAKAFGFLRDIEVERVARVLATEHPQTIALVAAHQSPEKAAAILREFDLELQQEVASRIATLGPVSRDLVVQIEDTLRAKLEPAEEDPSYGDPAKALAAILNSAGSEVEESVLGFLGARDEPLAERVRALMFVFEDVGSLDDRSIQKILGKVDTKVLAVAMKGISDSFRQQIMGNLSERAKLALTEEAELLGKIRRSEVEEAQAEVVRIVRELEDEGDIVISRGGDSDFLE